MPREVAGPCLVMDDDMVAELRQEGRRRWGTNVGRADLHDVWLERFDAVEARVRDAIMEIDVDPGGRHETRSGVVAGSDLLRGDGPAVHRRARDGLSAHVPCPLQRGLRLFTAAGGDEGVHIVAVSIPELTHAERGEGSSLHEERWHAGVVEHLHDLAGTVREERGAGGGFGVPIHDRGVTLQTGGDARGDGEPFGPPERLDRGGGRCDGVWGDREQARDDVVGHSARSVTVGRRTAEFCHFDLVVGLGGKPTLDSP